MSKYTGTVVIQRTFYGGSTVEYDDAGKLMNKAPVCAWTICAEIRVQYIRADGDALRIVGERQFLFFDATSNSFVDVSNAFERPHDYQNRFIHANGTNDKQVATIDQERQVTIVIHRSSGTWDSSAIDAAMRRVFLGPREDLTDVVPDAWRTFLCHAAHAITPSCGQGAGSPPGPGGGPVMKVGGGVTAPRAKYTPDPQYSPLARRVGMQGTTVLYLVITPAGLPADIRIARPVGLGLDEKAIEAVQAWTFQPSTLDGKPVAVQINVEVNFRIP